MPFAVAGPVLGAVAGAGVSAALAPGTSGGSSSLYIPTGLSTADQQWQGLQNNAYQTYNDTSNNLIPYGLQSLSGGIAANNQYGGAYQNAANAAGAGYGNLANTLNTQSGLNYGTQQQLLAAGNQVYQNSLDPNQAQYKLSLNNLTQQTGATNSMYGLGSSAAGAGVQNQALSNFGINWNTQQLQNQIAGLGAYDSAAGAAGQYGQLANQQAAAAPGYQLQAGQTPYSTAQSIAGVPGQLGTAYGQYVNSNVYSPAQTLQGTAQNYMNSAEGVNATAFNAGNQSAGALGSAVSSGISGLGNQSQNLASYFGSGSGASGSFGGGNFSGAFTSSPYYSGGGNSYGFTM